MFLSANALLETLSKSQIEILKNSNFPKVHESGAPRKSGIFHFFLHAKVLITKLKFAF